MTRATDRPPSHQAKALMRAMQIFLTLYDKATVNHVICFLHVASEAAKGNTVHMREMAKDVNMTQTTVSRVVRHMADRSYIHEKGLKLLKITVDFTDERFRLIHLTNHGQLIINQILDIAYRNAP